MMAVMLAKRRTSGYGFAMLNKLKGLFFSRDTTRKLIVNQGRMTRDLVWNAYRLLEIKIMSNKQEILDAIAAIDTDVDAVAVAVDSLEKAVLEGRDSASAFAEIKERLGITKSKTSALKSDAEVQDESDLPVSPTE
jgi:hypothetical protein